MKSKTHTKYLTQKGTVFNSEVSIDRLMRFKEFGFIAERPFMSTDLFRAVMGDKLGEGAFRAVYDCNLIKGVVVKVATDTRANLLEYNIWRESKKTAYAKWLAPCIDISPCGHFLFQKKVRMIKETDKLPKRVPNAFEDIKKSNWGFIGNRLVCFDYQFISRSLDIAFGCNMRDANWVD